MRTRFLFLMVFGLATTLTLNWTRAVPAQEIGKIELNAPAGVLPVNIMPAGGAILPNGRRITPRGANVKVAPHPYGMVLSPDGSTLVTVNSGTAPFSVSIVTHLTDAHPTLTQIPPEAKPVDADPKSVFMGAAIAPDNRTLYVSEGNNGRVGIFDLVTHQRLGGMALDDAASGIQDSLTGDMKLSPDGRYLFVLDIAHFRLVVFDTSSRQIASSTRVGLFPFGLALSADGRSAYVSNIGMFTYSLIPGLDPQDPKDTGLNFPPYGFPSKEAAMGVTVEGRRIPGLGDPNGPGCNSVWALDISDPRHPEVKAELRTGIPVGPKSVGGSSPGALVAGRKSIFVSNSTQDSIVEIDARTLRLKRTLVLEPADSVRGLRGILPFGLALSPDEERLYVACAGINAVAVINAHHLSVEGYIPTAWFPSRVAVSANGKTLYVANAKGFGAGPNGGPNFHAGPEGTYIGDITRGVVSIVAMPDSNAFPAETNQMLANNGFLPDRLTVHPPNFPIPSPERPQSSKAPLPASEQIKHVIFVVKENRTFDQVLGDVASVGGEKVNGEPSIAASGYGEDATVRPGKDEDQTTAAQAESLPVIEHARVTPNHHALIGRFGISDNFYVDGDVSVDGHHWLVGNYPNELEEAGWPAAYGGQFDFKPDPDAPGRLEIGACNPWPETYLEAGSLWEHLAQHHITFRNYGEALEMPDDDEEAGTEPTGVREVVNVPMPEVLFENTSRIYPTFNTNISDQYRFQQFKKEWEDFASGRKPMPQFMYIWLPDDHTADPRPADGYPYRASYVADNDLALGKLVHLISHSQYWKNTAIFVTEDDAQSGTDHVDAHRSLLLVISPYSRRGVSHVHTSMASIMKTFDLVFGLPYLNQYDAAATDLSDSFTEKPDFTPYNVLPPDTRIFDPAKVVGGALEHGEASEPLDNPNRMRRELQEQSIHPKAEPPG